jgi:WD40 repeat protein
VEWKHPGRLTALAWSPDGKTLASAGDDGNGRIHDAATGKRVHLLVGPKGPIRSLAYAPGGKLLATGDDRGVIRLWNPATGKEVRALHDESWVSHHDLAFSPDGNTLASATGGSRVRRWEAATGKEKGDWRVGGLKESLNGVRYVEGGKFLVLCGQVTLNEGSTWATLRLRQAGADGEVRFGLEGPKHRVGDGKGGGGPRPWASSADGKALAWGRIDHAIAHHDLRTGRLRALLRGHKALVTALAYLPDGKTLLSADRAGAVLVWDLETGKPRGALDKQGKVVGLALSPDGKRLAVARADGVTIRTVRRWLALARRTGTTG